MSFSQHLVLWLHVAFVIFTIGPVTLAIMSTPRYIRKRDVRVLRYLTRMTFIFGIGSLGVLLAGFGLATMISKAGKPWIIVSATLFVVAILLLGLIHRDQRHAIKALEAAAATAATAATAAGVRDGPASATAASQEPGAGADGGQAPADQAPADQAPGGQATGGPAAAAGETAAGTGQHQAGEPATAIPEQLASVERGRIAMIGGVVSLIWLVSLVLMIWNS